MHEYGNQGKEVGMSPPPHYTSKWFTGKCVFSVPATLLCWNKSSAFQKHVCGCGVRSCSYQGHSKNFTELYKFKATVWIFRDFRDSRPTHKKKKFSWQGSRSQGDYHEGCYIKCRKGELCTELRGIIQAFECLAINANGQVPGTTVWMDIETMGS